MIEYLPIGGLTVFVIGGLVAVKVELAKRPTFKEADDKYKNTAVCNEIHKAAEEKLKCIPEIKESVTKLKMGMNLLLKKNGLDTIKDD